MSQKCVVAIVVCLACVSAGFAEEKEKAPPTPKEKLFVVKLYERDKSVSCKIVTSEELKALEQEVALEARLSSRAMMAAEKAWKQREDTKNKTFPRSAVSPKKVAAAGSMYTDREKASAKLQALQAEQAERVEEERKEEERLSRAKDKKGIREREALQEKKSFMASARSLFEEELNKLLATEKKPAAPAPAAEPPQP